VAHAQRANAGLAGDGEGLRQQVCGGLAALDALAELDGLGGELRVREGLDGRLELVDANHDALVATQCLALTEGEERLKEVSHG